MCLDGLNLAVQNSKSSLTDTNSALLKATMVHGQNGQSETLSCRIENQSPYSLVHNQETLSSTTSMEPTLETAFLQTHLVLPLYSHPRITFLGTARQ